MKKTLFAAMLLCTTLLAFGEDPLMSGLDAYARSDWSSAMLSFRKAASVPGATVEPWYWLIMSELSSEEYGTALTDIGRFQANFPGDARIPDTLYQKGRILFLQGRYEDSISTLYQFITGYPDHAMVSSAYYWIGECLFSVGRFDEAKTIFSLVIEKYPQAIKREAAWYRISLVEQKDKEEDLLKLLKISHEESLKIIEDYQRREKTYEQAITAYQKRISDMMKDTRLGDLEKQLGGEKARNTSLQDRISQLEIQNAELAAALAASGKEVPAGSVDSSVPADVMSGDSGARQRALDELRAKAKKLQNSYESGTEGGK